VAYKRPRAINPVSITLAIIAAAMVYVAYSLWPIISLRANVKDEMADGLPNLWRLNLRPDEIALPGLAELKKHLVEQLRKQGVKDKKLEVTLVRGKKLVAIEARYTASAVFPYWGKRVDIACSPRVETDAARIEW
jgi:hypothetical protein